MFLVQTVRNRAQFKCYFFKDMPIRGGKLLSLKPKQVTPKCEKYFVQKAKFTRLFTEHIDRV